MPARAGEARSTGPRTMPNFAANLSMMYTEHPFLERLHLSRCHVAQALRLQTPHLFQELLVRREIPHLHALHRRLQ